MRRLPTQFLARDLVTRSRTSLTSSRSRRRDFVRMTKFRLSQADFAETLYHRNRLPLHLVLDEADAFAPQRPMHGQERMLGALQDLVRRGLQAYPKLLEREAISTATGYKRSSRDTYSAASGCAPPGRHRARPSAGQRGAGRMKLSLKQEEQPCGDEGGQQDANRAWTHLPPGALRHGRTDLFSIRKDQADQGSRDLLVSRPNYHARDLFVEHLEVGPSADLEFPHFSVRGRSFLIVLRHRQSISDRTAAFRAIG